MGGLEQVLVSQNQETINRLLHSTAPNSSLQRVHLQFDYRPHNGNLITYEIGIFPNGRPDGSDGTDPSLTMSSHSPENDIELHHHVWRTANEHLGKSIATRVGGLPIPEDNPPDHLFQFYKPVTQRAIAGFVREIEFLARQVDPNNLRISIEYRTEPRSKTA